MADFFSTAATRPRSARTIAVDNFLRKALKIGDPRDPAQVANALLARYPQDAERERRERIGLPYSTLGEALPASAGAAGGAAMSELVQARDDIERDLDTLINSSALKDISVELGGWGRAIRQIAAEGLAAARLALDAVSHDQAMAARRGLGEYARLARYLGALNEAGCGYFRRLAQSCDTLAALILVAIGEGLAASGITRSTSIVRVAASELQSRRNAVVGALRSLTGSIEAVLGQEEWPRGLEAYRNLVRRLDADGQADLRALLNENALSQAMDELVDLATGASVNGLRELSTASSLLIHRFQRLIAYGQVIVAPIDRPITDGPPESPPLTAFISALQLFVDAFSRMGAGRLLYLARPPIVVYGLYGLGGPDAATRRLLRLATLRGEIVELIDCLACCGCDANSVRGQILLDYLIFSIDRTIDLYALGTQPNGRGDPERRAAVTGLLVRAALNERAPGNGPFLIPNQNVANDPLRAALARIEGELMGPFGQNLNNGWVFGGVDAPRSLRLALRELRINHQIEAQIERLVQALSPICFVTAVFEYGLGPSLIRSVLRTEILRLDENAEIDAPHPVQLPAPIASALASMAQERPDLWADHGELD